MMGLVNDLLDLAQISNGKFKKNESVFSIRKVIKDVVLIQEYKANRQGVAI
jgi:signal transduction histidine kinase